MGINDRLRKLEEHFGDRGPSPEEVIAAIDLLTQSARAKLHGKSLDEERLRWARDVIGRWKRAQGVDISQEAEKAREKLKAVGRSWTDKR